MSPKKNIPVKISSTLALFLIAFSFNIYADVKMSDIFGDHMVLQQDKTIPIWGTASANEDVSVQLGKGHAEVLADSDGKWRVDLPAQPGTTTPQILTITGKNTLTYQDVLLGDVWLASGQSNMQYGLGNTGDTDVVHQTDQPLIRIFFVPRRLQVEPMVDIPEGPANIPLAGKWQVCTQQTIYSDGEWGGFSAVAFYFAKEIQQNTGHAIGLIGCYWGGTPAQVWTSASGLQKDPQLNHHLDDFQKFVPAFKQLYAAYLQKKADYPAQKSQWDQEIKPAYDQALADWKTASEQAKAAGQPLPPMPQPSRPEPQIPNNPELGTSWLPWSGTVLFNGMLAPLIPYALKGVIWYQGEANTASAEEYDALFPALIADWREHWNQGDFPFLFVQLANFGGAQPNESWPRLRESQTKALTVAQTGMAVTIDIGNPQDIHPQDKKDVGHRLALAAEHIAYGQDVIFQGPMYKSMQILGNTIQIAFTNSDGLKIGGRPAGFHGQPASTKELTGFTIAGDDRVWKPATATIEDQSVVVSSNDVNAPVAVRYGWSNSPECNLYNGANLPASPFRTDDWKK
jgi:sialate O-acetylesterase